jgi:alpha-1,3-glucan synthase
MFPSTFFVLHLLFGLSATFPYDESEIPWNLNMNKDASGPMEYAASYDNHSYHPSPTNWRFPWYSFMVDRFVNGDPTK